MSRYCDGPCALKELEAAGLTPEMADHVALNETCFPMDCEVATQQAREYLILIGRAAGPMTRAQRRRAAMEWRL